MVGIEVMERGLAVKVKKGKAADAECCVLVIGVPREGLKGPAKELDKVLDRTLTRIIGGVDAGPRPGKTHLMFSKHLSVSPERVLLVGIGRADRSAKGLEGVRVGFAAAAKEAERLELKNVTAVLPPRVSADLAQAMVEGFVLGAYKWDRFMRSKRKGASSFTLLAGNAQDLKNAKKGADVGIILAETVCMVRDLANTPGNELSPSMLADLSKELAKRYRFGCKVRGPKEIERMGMNGLLTVNMGSALEPRFIELEYDGRKKKTKKSRPIVLVGKAITFDSGGISLKAVANMDQMKYDMAGGATVLGVITAVARLRLPVHLHVLIPSSENLPGARAYKPGDVIKYKNGRTVEIISTDAEGRLILADALIRAGELDPQRVVDIATLTGGVKVALGKIAAGLLGNDDRLVDALQRAGEASFERVWRFPLWPEYGDIIKGDTADIKNSGGREASTITAAAFLSNFVSYPWAHIDIAGMAWWTKSKGYVPKCATGFGVRLFVQWFRSMKGR